MTIREAQKAMREATVTIGTIPVETLEAIIQDADTSLRRATSFGPILDPTAYRNASATGEIADARLQLKIARKYLEIRKLIDAMSPAAAVGLVLTDVIMEQLDEGDRGV